MPPLTAGLLSCNRGSGGGTLFPQPWVESPEGQRLLDAATGTGWRLVVDARDPVACPEALPSDVARIAIGPADRDPAVLIERDGVVANWFDRNACRAALVQPDH